MSKPIIKKITLKDNNLLLQVNFLALFHDMSHEIIQYISHNFLPLLLSDHGHPEGLCEATWDDVHNILAVGCWRRCWGGRTTSLVSTTLGCSSRHYCWGQCYNEAH